MLAAMANRGTLTAAAKAGGISRSTLWEWCHNEDGPLTAEERQALNVALLDAHEQAADAMEAAIYERGQEGVVEYQFYQGQPIGFWIDKETDEPVSTSLAERLAERAYDEGTEIPVRFEPYLIRKMSDTAAIFWLKGARPEKYRERTDSQLTGAGGGPIQVNVTVARAREEIAAILLDPSKRAIAHALVEGTYEGSGDD